MSAHEAGAMHAPGYGGVAIVPAWLSPPQDLNALLPMLWAGSVRRRTGGVLVVAGVDVRDLAAEFGTPAYVLDETDFRDRARAFRDSFAHSFADLCGGADVYYAGKAFLCTAVARWIAEEGLGLDTCSGGELTVALRGGVAPERIILHGNNKSDAELERALRLGVGRVVVDSLAEIEQVAAIARRLRVRAGVVLRVTVGVEAHTHEYIATAHEDQKFGLSLAGGQAAEGVRRVLAHPELELLGVHSHIGSQIFDTGGHELSARRLIALYAETVRRHGVTMPELGLGGGFGIAYTSEHDPLEPKVLADQLAGIVARECRAQDVPVPRIAVEPGRAIVGPTTFTLYTVGAVKDVALGHGSSRRYVAVDGGMSDNIRPALYNADYSCTLASRSSDAEPVLSRVVGRHCESGDIVVRDEYLPSDVARGDLLAVPGTGAYCRALASQYNHVGRSPVIAVRDGEARVIMRRETEEDLLALDVG